MELHSNAIALVLAASCKQTLLESWCLLCMNIGVIKLHRYPFQNHFLLCDSGLSP